MVGNKIKLSKFEQEVNKIMCTTPEYVQLIEQMEEVQAKQVALDKKYVEIAAQIQAARDEYRPLVVECNVNLQKRLAPNL